MVQGYAAAQQVLADHADAVLATGVPTFPEQPDAVVGWVTDLLDALARAAGRRPAPARPTTRPPLVADGLPRIHDAAERLPRAACPPSLQHNDLHLGNAFRRPGGAMAYIDLGDALWAHPLTTARIPLWIVRNRLGLAAGRRPRSCGAVDAYLEPWTDRWDREHAASPCSPTAERISCLHRAESWRRLQADVPAGRSTRTSCARRRVARRRRRPDPYASGLPR